MAAPNRQTAEHAQDKHGGSCCKCTLRANGAVDFATVGTAPLLSAGTGLFRSEIMAFTLKSERVECRRRCRPSSGLL